MLQKCTYNSQYIAHGAQVEPIIMLIMRCEETQLHYHIECSHFQFYMCLDSKVGTN